MLSYIIRTEKNSDIVLFILTIAIEMHYIELITNY